MVSHDGGGRGWARRVRVELTDKHGRNTSTLTRRFAPPSPRGRGNDFKGSNSGSNCFLDGASNNSKSAYEVKYIVVYTFGMKKLILATALVMSLGVSLFAQAG